MFSKLVGFFKQAATPLSNANSQTLSQNPLPIDNKETKNNENNKQNQWNKENNNPNNSKKIFGINFKTENTNLLQNENFSIALENNQQQRIIQFEHENTNTNIEYKSKQEFRFKDANTNKGNQNQLNNEIDNISPLYFNNSKP